MSAALLAALLAGFARGAAPAAASTAPAAGLGLGASSMTVASLYTGDKVRDPFVPPAQGVGARVVAEETGVPTVDIHALSLKGLLKDDESDYALFSSDRGSYMLRGGKLYNERNKLVPGVKGQMNLKQRTVVLETADKDVQPFRLGEGKIKPDS